MSRLRYFSLRWASRAGIEPHGWRDGKVIVPLTAVNVLFHFGWPAGGQSGPQRSNGAHVQITVHYSYLKLLYKSISGRKERTVLYAQKKVCAPKVNCSRVIEQTALSETFVDHLCGPKTLTTSPLCELDCLCSHNYRRNRDQRHTCESTEAQTHAFKNVSRFKMARTGNDVQKRQKSGFCVID